MANVKITDLTALTSPEITDVLPIVDVNTDVTKKVSVGEIVGKISGDVTVGTDGTAAITGGVIVNADVNASAAIAGTKIDPDFGSQTVETTGVINAGSGTEGAPSVSVGTTDNGLYSPGTDQVAISTNGTGRLFIDTSGNVGVKKSDPDYDVHILNTAGAVLSIDRSDAVLEDLDFIGGLRFGNSDTAGDPPHGTGIKVVAASTFGNAKMHFLSGSRDAWDDDEYALTIDAAGEVGINTPSPSYALDVSGGFNVSGVGTSAFTVDTDAPNNSLIIASDGKVGLGSSTPDALLTVNGISSFGAGAVGTPSIARSGDLDTGFWFPAANTLAASTAGTERIRVDGSGNVNVDNGTFYVDAVNNRVSIGTTSPSSLLHLADAGDITVGTTTGTKIGTATSQKIGFYNATPVVQPTAVADITTTATSGSLPTPDGSVTIADAATPTVTELLEYCVELEAKLEAALGHLRNLGLIAT